MADLEEFARQLNYKENYRSEHNPEYDAYRYGFVFSSNLTNT